MKPGAAVWEAAREDSDFDVSGVQEVMVAARPIYNLWGAGSKLQGYYPKGPHAFPPHARNRAYAWLDNELK